MICALFLVSGFLSTVLGIVYPSPGFFWASAGLTLCSVLATYLKRSISATHSVGASLTIVNAVIMGSVMTWFR
jgi:hypothetical protein